MTRPGLCERCGHARVVETRRGSMFWMCGRWKTDPRFPRYPVLPVVFCPGFEPGAPDRNRDENRDENREEERG